MNTISRFIAAAVLTAAGLCQGAEFSARHIDKDFVPDANASKPVWNNAGPITIEKSWNDKDVYPALRTTARLLWSDKYMYVLFEAPFEKLVVDPNIKPDANGDCWGIWNFDVVEMFIGDASTPRQYKEFVVSPLRQRIDIAHNVPVWGKRKMSTEFSSGWETAVHVDEGKKLWVTEIRIPLCAISNGAGPAKSYKFNMYRCVGSEPDCKYMAMSPTMTKTPNFHVIKSFCKLELTK